MTLFVFGFHRFVYSYLSNDKLPNTLKPLRLTLNGIKTSNLFHLYVAKLTRNFDSFVCRSFTEGQVGHIIH